MARRKIREYDAKRLLITQLAPIAAKMVNFRGILVNLDTDLSLLPQQYPWLLTEKLVVKPDQLFGKRKQYGLVVVDVDFEAVKSFITEKQGKEITISKTKGALTHFLVEPFVPHQQEYYLAIVAERDGDRIYFSEQGGYNIEERWESVTEIFVPTLEKAVVITLPEQVQLFVSKLHELFAQLDFTYLELNPFTLNAAGEIALLDVVAQVDDSAAWKNAALWKNLEFPEPFGRMMTEEEKQIERLDQNSGASLKLTLLNPQGKIWNILSGGGASILYLDALARLGGAGEIANYGEYSGNPTPEESYQYAKTILELMIRNEAKKVLFISGAIANFTDVEKTFYGVAKALREYGKKLRSQRVSIFVRRGGPNYEQGLKLMKQTGVDLGLPMTVYGPEMPLTRVVPLGLASLPFTP